MKIISYNVNGIRAALKKDFVGWLKKEQADVICLQETKANKEQVDISEIEALGYQTFWFSAQKKGYSGVAIFTKINVVSRLFTEDIFLRRLEFGVCCLLQV